MMLALTIALVLMANLGAWAYLRDHPVNRAVSRVGQKWQMIEQLNGPVDWVVLGDSSCGQGIHPFVLAEVLGGTAANFCTVANATVVNDAWMLRRYIEKYGPPKGVVLFHVFHVWERETTDLVSLLDQIPLKGRFWRDYDPPISLSTSKEIEFLVKPATTLWYSNLSVKHLLRVVGNSLSTIVGVRSVTSEPNSDLAYVIRHGGFVEEATPRPEKVERDTTAHIQKYGQAPFRMTEHNRLALRAIVGMADQHRFKVYISNSSIAASLYSDPGIRRFFGEMQRALEEEVSDSRQVAFVLREPPQYLPHQMDNVDHVVGADNAADLTRKLAAAMREAEGGM